jgi:hypothetical protein
MIYASVYLLVFIRNLLVHLAEKILLMQPLTFGGDYLFTASNLRHGRRWPISSALNWPFIASTKAFSQLSPTLLPMV